MNSVSFDQPLKNKKLRQIKSKVVSAVDEETHEVFYWCSECQDWINGNPQIDIVNNLDRRGNKYSCFICGNELKFEQERRVHYGM